VRHDTDRHWEQWGAQDPYFAVVTKREFHADVLESNKARFFASGQIDIDLALGYVEKLYGQIPRGRALDFGCGVGRLVVSLARHFGEVVGVDVSDSMLAEAERNCAALPNVAFVKSDDALSHVHGAFDLVHSYIVLQHIPTQRGLRLTDRLLRAVRPGGVAVLHFSLARTLGPGKAAVYALKHYVPGGRHVLNILQGRPWDAPGMEMNEYALTDLFNVFAARGFEEIVVVPDVHPTAMTARIFGRRKAKGAGAPS
jgi:SAM-dependent methyltransferase